MLPRNTTENADNESKQPNSNVLSSVLSYSSAPVFFGPTNRTPIELFLIRKGDFIEGFFKVNTLSYPIKEKIEAGYVDKIKEIINKGISIDESQKSLVADLSVTCDIYDKFIDRKFFHRG